MDQRRTVIARPRGIQHGIDFDKVEERLIRPALRRLGIENAATISMGQHQSVPMASFQQFLAAQLIVADVSVHNPTLLHHVQIRETLQGRLTFLLCAKHSDQAANALANSGFLYDETNLGASVDKLVAYLYRKTESLTTNQFTFALLAECQADVPAEFRQYVERALVARQIGDLEFLANEIQGVPWENEGMRLIGCAELAIKSYISKRVLLYIDQIGKEENGLKKHVDMEVVVKRIHNLIANESMQWKGVAFAIAGCASIEEIIFHEACLLLDIPTTLYLPLPKEKCIEFLKRAGNTEWLDRFNHLEAQLPSRILTNSEMQPLWLKDRAHYSVKQRSHYWMLHNALVNGGENLTLFTSIKQQEEQNTWSDAAVIEQARLHGANIVIVDTEEKFSIHDKTAQYYSSF